jgi:hypothetical protein
MKSAKVLPFHDVKQGGRKVEFESTTLNVSNVKLTLDEKQLLDKFKVVLAHDNKIYHSINTTVGHCSNCTSNDQDGDIFVEEDEQASGIKAIEEAYAQFQDIKLGAIDIVLCPDSSLISTQFTIRCILIKAFEGILLLYAFASIPIYNNPFFNDFVNTSEDSESSTTYVPLSFIIICMFAYYVQLNLMTGIRNSLLLIRTKDFKPIKNWKYRLKFILEVLEIILLIALCFFALSVYIYEYNLELIFNGTFATIT